MTTGLLLCLVMTQIQPALAQVEQGQESAGGTQSAPAVVVSHHSSGKQLPVPANSARGIMRSPASHGLPVASPTSRSSTRSATAIDFISDAADWLLTEQQMSGGFPWTAGTTNVFINTQAPTAYGLIQAFRRTGDSNYINAATDAGDFLLANPNNFPSTSIKRFTAADTLFLVELTRATGDSQYRDLVVNDFWNRLEAGNYGPDSNWDAADFVAAEFDRRASIPEVVAWDLSWGVVAAHIEGRTAIAQAFLDGIVESLESVPVDGAENDLVGLAGAVWAAARTGLELDPTSGKWAAHDSTMDLANTLLTFQQPSGGILFNSSSDPMDTSDQDTQVTAFTLLALDLLDRDGFAAQIASAGQYLIDQQQMSGQILSYPTAGVGDQGGVEVHGESMVAWASSQMRPGLIESVAATGATPTATDNDYTRINNAVQMALDDDVIQLSGTFDWTEPNAFNSWVNGSDGVADTGDDFAILYPAGRNSITLTAANPGAAVILGPGDLAVQNLEGFVVVASAENRNLEFSNLRIEGFDLSIGMFFVPGQGVNLYDGTRIVNNRIIMPTDIAGNTDAAERLQNIGIHFAFGDNQLIADNIIDIPGDGTSTASTTSADVAMQSNTSSGAYEGLIIENNEVRILNAPSANPQNVVGIWENSNASDRNIIIRNNRFVNLAPNNDPADNRQQGFRITSQRNTSTGNGTLMTGNLAQGANIGYAWLSFESFGADFSSRDPLDFVANTVIDNATGIRLDSNGSANFKCNIISGNATDGIANINQDQGIMSDATVNWWGCNDGPGTGSCDQISGNGVDGDNWLLFELEANPDSIGVGDSSSLTASLLNTVNGDDSPTLAGCTVPDGLDVDFAGGAAFGNVAPAMDTLEDGLAGSTFNATTAGVANDITATVNAGQTANTTILIDSPIGGSQLFVDDEFAGEEFGTSVTFAHPALPAPGTTPANIGVNAFATVEDAQAVADTGADILIAAGNYGQAAGDPDTTLSITVDGLSLLGPNTQTAGDSATRVPEAVFNYHIFSTRAANITVDGLAIEGPSDFAVNIVHDEFDGLKVINNTFQRGINAVTVEEGSNHLVANNLITDLTGLDGRNTAIVFAKLTDPNPRVNSVVRDNVMRGVRNGISVTHDDMTISNNDIQEFSGGAINPRGGAHTIADNVIVGGDGPAHPSIGFILGITLIHDATLEVTGNVLTGNDISNTDVAIFVLDGAQPDASGVPNSASNNLLGGNVVGLQNDDPDAFDATCNWWGDTSGPAGAGNGSGSQVTGNVLFQPWNTSTTGPCDGALELSFMPTDVNFGGVLDGTTDTSIVTIENTGDAPVTISIAALMNDTANVFSIINNTCSSLAVAANCQIELRFAPQSVQTFNASLEISSDAGTDTVPISGEGLATAALAINPASFDFGGVVVGDTATTSFTLSNNGDPVSSLTLSTIAITGADFSVTGGTCSTTTPVDGGDTCTVVVQFAPQETGAASGSLDVMSDVGNVSASLSGNGLDSVADLSISKQLDSDPVIAGTAVTYTVTVSNAGPSTAVAVVASDVLDAKLLENASATGCNNDPDGLPDCQLGDLAPGDDVSFTITADLLSSATDTLENTATVTSSTDDPDAANNAASITAAIDTVSDLVITQVDSVDPVPAGAALSYNVTVINNGPSDAINVTTGGLLPLQVTDPQVGTCIANPSDPNGCSLGNIAAGEVITYQQDMTVLSNANGATLENMVSVNSDTTDDDAGNNMATEDTAVIAVADLAIDKVSGTVFTNPEASIEYTITVTNPGPSDVLAARVTDMPPTRLGNLDWMCEGVDGGICSNATGMGDIDELVDLPAGSSVVFILMADLQDDLEQPVTNTASVAAPADASDPASGNNQASDTDAIGMFADGFEDLDGQ